MHESVAEALLSRVARWFLATGVQRARRVVRVPTYAHTHTGILIWRRLRRDHAGEALSTVSSSACSASWRNCSRMSGTLVSSMLLPSGPGTA